VCSRVVDLDGVGRRATLLVSLAGMALSNAVIALCFTLDMGVVATLATLSYIAAYSAGAATVGPDRLCLPRHRHSPQYRLLLLNLAGIT